MALVEMKRLRAVALQSRRRSLLRQLRREGCVEVETAQESTDFGQENALERTTEENTGAREYLTVIGQAMEVLSKYVPPPSRPLLAGKPQLTESQLYDEKVLDKALAAARQINKAAEEMNRLLGEIGRLEGTVTQLKPWKTLDVPLEYHMDGAVEYLRGVLPGAADLKELEEELAEKAPACQMEQVSSDNEQHYVTFLIHQSCKEQAMAIIKQRGFAQAPQEGEGTPAQYIGALEKQMAQMEQQRQDLIGKIKECGDAYRAMEQALDAYSMEAEEDQLLSGLVRTKNTVVITGWLPKKAQERVKKVLEREGCAYSMEDPQEGEDPPTAMENGPLAEPFNAITEMYGMPRYGSLIDPNPLMVPFYITFFAFIMGDAVYGILIALGCFLGLKLLKPKGTMRQMLTLFFYCGLGTIVAGVLMGGWLGDAVPAFTEGVLGKRVELPALWFNPMEEPMKMLIFSLALGGIQILTGMAASAWRQIRQKDYLGALCDTGTWYMIFAGIGLAVLGIGVGQWLIIAGVVLMLLLGGRDKKGFGRITGGLGKLYGITGFVSDLLSYSRIMALGLSGAVVGSVVNKMGAMGGGGIIGVLLFVVVAIIGHTFNIAISVLGAYVHTSRLQYIEFFGRFYEDGGRMMHPLKIKTKYVDVVKED